MISLQRKVILRAQASLAQNTERSIAALARTTQAAHSTVAVGDVDVPLVDTVQDARDSAELLPGLEDGTSLAGDDAWEAWDQSDYAIELSGRLETELGEAKVELDQALEEAARALADAGLARSEAAQAVADAADAAAAATQAIQDALEASQLAEGAAPSWNTVDPVAADASGKPVGAIWYVRNTAGNVIRMWELTALGWIARPFDETVIPQVAIGGGTYGALAGDRLVAKSITAAQIKALAITAAELATNSVTAVKIAANAVTAAKIVAGAVTTDKLNALAVTAEKIAVGAIVADKIAAGAITTAKLAATAIDGMTITGALIRTAPTGQRMELDANGLRAVNAAGQTVATMSPAGAGLMVGMPGSSRFQVLRDEARDGTYAGVARPGNYPAGKSNMARLVVDDVFADKFYDSAALELAAGGTSYASFRAGPAASSDHGASISVTGALQINATKEIDIHASRIILNGPLDVRDGNALVTPASGWSVHSAHMHKLTRIGSLCFLNVTFFNGSGGGIADMGLVPTGFRPPAGTFIGVTKAGSTTFVGEVYLEPTGKLSIPYFTGSANSGTYFPLSAVWHV